MDLEFEWDDVKNAGNIQKHGVEFVDAVRVFYDDMRVSKYDSRNDHGEDRYQVVGMSYGKILLVVYTERHENTIRIISARKADKREVAGYYHGDF